MPTKREILSTLADDELQMLVQIFELATDASLPREDLLDRLVRSRRAELQSILACMPRPRVVEACVAVGVSVGSAPQDTLVRRLMEKKPQTAPSEDPAPPIDASHPRAEVGDRGVPAAAAAAAEPPAAPKPLTTTVEVGPDGMKKTHTRLKHLTIIRARREPAVESA